MRGRTALRIASGLTLTLTLGPVACGGGGGLETAGIEPAEYYQMFSGGWVLGEGEALRTQTALAVLDPSQTSGRRRRSSMGNQPDPRAMRVVHQLSEMFPPRIALTVTDAVVTQDLAGPGMLEVLIDGGATAVEAAPGFRMNVSADWDGPRLRIERSLPGVGEIVDRLEPADGGARLHVRRNVVIGTQRVEVRVDYFRPS